jgi:hypothetical protein
MIMSGKARKPAVLLVQEAGEIAIAPQTDDSGINWISISVGNICIRLSPYLAPEIAQQLIGAHQQCKDETKRWLDTVSSALAAYRNREDEAQALTEPETNAEAVSAVIYSETPVITSRSSGVEDDFDCIDIECPSSGDGVTLFCADIDMDDFIDRLRSEWDSVQERWDNKFPNSN